MLAGCTAPIDLDDAPCPCAEDWQCCAPYNICAPEDAACPAFCGNGLVEDGEVCDDGEDNRSTYNLLRACNRECTAYVPHCGDSILDPTETCDDGNILLEDCDYGLLECGTTCGPTCEPTLAAAHYCGDGQIDSADGETCDDADLMDWNGCTNACTASTCHNLTTNPSYCLSPDHFLATGGRHTCAISDTGSIRCWGAGTTNSSCRSDGPDGWFECGQADPPDGENFVQVSAGLMHTCAIDENRQLQCWGVGAIPDRCTSEGLFSICAQASPPDGEFVMVASGDAHSCAIRLDGTVACWGLGTTNTDTTVAGQAIPPDGTFRYLCAGGTHTCGLRPNGKAECWGNTSYGQSTPDPELTFAMLSCGYFHTCGIQRNGELICWGNRSQENPAATTSIYSMVSAGTDHTCALDVQGAMVCWQHPQPFDDEPEAATPQSTALEGTFSALSAGNYHNCSLRDDHTLVCWGAGTDSDCMGSSTSSPYFDCGQAIPPQDFTPTFP